eukprot:4455240-Karenia_brevis.AAC.1
MIFLHLDAFDGTYEIVEVLTQLYSREGEGCLKVFLRDDDLRLDFVAYDLRDIKVANAKQHLSPHIPATLSSTQVVQDEQDDPYICDAIMPNGSICGAQFKTENGLRLHVQNTKKEVHPRMDSHMLSSLVLTNVCIHCETTLATRQVAIRHVRQAHIQGYCRAEVSKFVHSIDHLQEYVCPICLFTCETLHEYHFHVGQHLPSPTVKVGSVEKVVRHKVVQSFPSLASHSCASASPCIACDSQNLASRGVRGYSCGASTSSLRTCGSGARHAVGQQSSRRMCKFRHSRRKQSARGTCKRSGAT